MSQAFSHAQLLRERGRHEEAVSALLSHLAGNPQDPLAYMELALNRMEIDGQLRQALEDARTASGLLPDVSYTIALQSRILSQLERHGEALTLAESAVAMDPGEAGSWIAKSIALIGLSRWKDAEEASRTALSLDSDNEAASNLLAHTLRMQNRLDASEEESRRRLERNPENAFSFANAGWASLQRGDVKGAENHFKEALRIDPNMAYAKDGLKQSYRARSAFFRLYLKWAFLLQRFSEKNRVLVIIGLVFGFRILRNLAASVHPLLVIPVVVIYYIFVFGSFISGALANFFLLRDPVARLSLEPSEKVEGAVMGVLFLGGLLCFAGGFASGVHALGVAGAAMMVAALPFSMTATNPSVTGKWIFSFITVAILLCGGIITQDIAAHPGRELFVDRAGQFMMPAVLLAVISTWLSMVPALRKAKPR